MEKVISHNKKERERRKQSKSSTTSQKQDTSSQPSEKKDDPTGSPLAPSLEMCLVEDAVGTSLTTPVAKNTPTTTPGKRPREDEDAGDPVVVRNEERQSPKRHRLASPQNDLNPPTGVSEVMAGGSGVYVC